MGDDSLDLAQRFADGDGAAFDLLIERHLPGLRAYVRSKLGVELRAQESASDIVQSTCRELIEHTERFQHPSSSAFRRWLFTTASRKVSNRLQQGRTVKRDGGAQARIGVSSGLGDSGLIDFYRRFSNPGESLERADEMERVERALDRLPADQREVILLVYAAELPRSEISERLGKPEATVRSLLHRGLTRLSVVLGEPGEPA